MATSVTYRSYIDNPVNYDWIAGVCFSLLFREGMRAHHRVADVGCGSLRVGRLLIPYLDKGNYCGLDPNEWLIDEGRREEVGEDQVRLKQPVFLTNADFDLESYGHKFDFILAHSIFTHTHPGLFIEALQRIRRLLRPGGRFLFTVIERPVSMRPPGTGWIYPQCIAYEPAEIASIFAAAGLRAQRIDWPHVNQGWFGAGR
jgi:SAM-dependent methyltransferase